MKKVLFICTGNSCRSQMAEGFMKQYKGYEAFSAGTKPAEKVNSNAILVMKELGIDISKHLPKLVNEFLNSELDLVVTVCDSAKETCPIFTGKVKKGFILALKTLMGILLIGLEKLETKYQTQ